MQSIEPISATYSQLLDNINLNCIGERVVALNIGIGEESGFLHFTAGLDTVNHVVAKSEKGIESIRVKIERLDDVLSNFEPKIIKIDVEGFETNVIAGADRVLSRKSLMAVIMELNGSGERYGFDENRLHRTMLKYGFRPFRYLPFERRLVALDGQSFYSGNTLYIRNVEEIQVRLKGARHYTICNVNQKI
jgi:FkbM family methyltransferase